MSARARYHQYDIVRCLAELSVEEAKALVAFVKEVLLADDDSTELCMDPKESDTGNEMQDIKPQASTKSCSVFNEQNM